MAINAKAMVATTKIKSNVKVNSIDEAGISVSDTPLPGAAETTYVFKHGPKRYSVKPIQNKMRVTLKGMIKEVSFFFIHFKIFLKEYNQFGVQPGRYTFDLTIDFDDDDQYWNFLSELRNQDYNKPIRQN